MKIWRVHYIFFLMCVSKQFSHTTESSPITYILWSCHFGPNVEQQCRSGSLNQLSKTRNKCFCINIEKNKERVIGCNCLAT